MKPNELKYPHLFKERRPLIAGRVFFVPDYYFEHHLFSFPALEDERLFGNSNPVFVEYCSGNGSWIVEKAKACRDKNWIAVERDFERARKIVSKTVNGKLANLFVVCGEALPFTRHYLRDQSIEGIFINFPDPWPKERHAKHRLFQSEFAKETARVVSFQKGAVVATDDPAYAENISSVMLGSLLWESAIPFPYYRTEWQEYGTSFFQALWEKKGRTIRYFSFLRR